MGYLAGTANGGPIHIVNGFDTNRYSTFMRSIRHECMALTEDGLWSTVGGGGLNSASSTGFGGTDMRNHPGIIATSVTTLTTDYAVIGSGSGVILFGGGIWEAKALIGINTLSDGTDTYTYRFGFMDTTTAADATDGAYFEYDSTTSANWLMCTSNNSTRTKTPSSIAVVASTWTLLTIKVNSDGTSADFFVNGVMAGSITTNIPTGSGRQTGAKIQMVKVAGTNQRIIYHDFLLYDGSFSTNRF